MFYDPGHAAGSCGLGPFPAGGRYASLPRRSYASGRACGSYVDVSGPAGTVRAEVVDVCPDCAAATVNLSRAAFARIADPRTGTVAVSYQPAVDPPLPGPLELRITAAGPPGSLAVQVLNHGNRLSSVAAGGPGGRWQRLVPGADGYWTGSLDAGDAAGGTPAGSQPPWAAHQPARAAAGGQAARRAAGSGSGSPMSRGTRWCSPGFRRAARWCTPRRGCTGPRTRPSPRPPARPARP